MASEHDRHKAARVLASGGTLREAGDAAGVSHQTISNWKRQPDFLELVDTYRAETRVVELHQPTPTELDLLPDDWREVASRSLALCVPAAMDTLRECLVGGDVTKAQTDVARWLVDRVGIEAPAPEAAGDIVEWEDLARQLGDSVDPRVLEAALARARGDVA